jgi:Cu/Ag efflux protein CusF
MNTRHIPVLALALLGASLSPLAAAQGLPALLVAQATSDMVDAEVRKLDRDRSRVTLKHAEIKHLDMPPMTMVFNVADQALLDKLAEGARVKVRVEQIGGKYVVTAVQAAP